MLQRRILGKLGRVGEARGEPSLDGGGQSLHVSPGLLGQPSGEKNYGGMLLGEPQVLGTGRRVVHYPAHRPKLDLVLVGRCWGPNESDLPPPRAPEENAAASAITRSHSKGAGVVRHGEHGHPQVAHHLDPDSVLVGPLAFGAEAKRRRGLRVHGALLRPPAHPVVDLESLGAPVEVESAETLGRVARPHPQHHAIVLLQAPEPGQLDPIRQADLVLSGDAGHPEPESDPRDGQERGARQQQREDREQHRAGEEAAADHLPNGQGQSLVAGLSTKV